MPADTPAALAALDTRLGQMVDAVSDTAFLCGESTDDAVLFLSYRRQLSAAKAALTEQILALLAAARQGEETERLRDAVDKLCKSAMSGVNQYVSVVLTSALDDLRAAAEPSEMGISEAVALTLPAEELPLSPEAEREVSEFRHHLRWHRHDNAPDCFFCNQRPRAARPSPRR